MKSWMKSAVGRVEDGCVASTCSFAPSRVAMLDALACATMRAERHGESAREAARRIGDGAGVSENAGGMRCVACGFDCVIVRRGDSLG